ncbi:MAG: ABC transporter permease [Coriobacteriaceae bacterium]|jgi:putative ABC transport system permease protein|nr:ABC transporter permease [Coriobacteriaceae bacterium]
MGIRDLIQETLFSLSSNKVRSFLTTLGIVIGIASVIAMTSLIGGMQKSFIDEMGLSQARMVQVSAYVPDRPLAKKDADALATAFPEYEDIAATAYGFATISTDKTSYETSVWGVTGNYFSLAVVKAESGRLLEEDDDRRLTRALVVGKGIVRELFGDEDAPALGTTVRIGPNAESYLIVGVIEGNGTSSHYYNAYMPMGTLQSRITGTESYDTILALAREGTDATELAVRTKEFLAQWLKTSEDNVFAYSMQEIINQMNVVMAGFSLMLTSIASISLFVGGIGIMNMMLTTVTERTREIGLRKSLGAHTSDITRQFLAESIALCLIGGFFGIVMGYAASWGLAGLVTVVQPGTSGFSPVLGIESVAIAAGVCALIGIVFGFYPARRAARLDPVESLRYQ